MKTLFIFLITMCCFVCSIQAQKPFTELGLDNEVEVITLSNGRYIEHVENDTLRQIGSVMFNMNTKKVEYFIPEDDLERVRIANRDREVSRFMAVDPLASYFSWNSPYAFSENRVVDGFELEGLEFENFMTNWKSPGELKVKLPTHGKTQYYAVSIKNSTMGFVKFKEEFKTNPNEYLSNSKATFNPAVDGDGKITSFQEGAFMKIDIIGPVNNSYVKVNSISEQDDGALVVEFYTMEGHVEKGIIEFKISQNDTGEILFEIRSNSEVDVGMLKNKSGETLARNQQKDSWLDMLSNLKEKVDGTQVGDLFYSNVTPEQREHMDKLIEKYQTTTWPGTDDE